MDGLVQIDGTRKGGYHLRRMKENGQLFHAKKSEGGRFYNILVENSHGNEVFFRHLAEVVEELSEEVKSANNS
jgi:hypothetical protein